MVSQSKSIYNELGRRIPLVTPAKLQILITFVVVLNFGIYLATYFGKPEFSPMPWALLILYVVASMMIGLIGFVAHNSDLRQAQQKDFMSTQQVAERLLKAASDEQLVRELTARERKRPLEFE